MDEEKVVLLNVRDELASALVEGIKLLGGGLGGLVFIKPNIGSFDRRRVVSTDPTLVEAIIDILKNKGISATNICVGEGVSLGWDVRECFEVTGFRTLCEANGVQLLDLNVAERVEREWRYGKIAVPKVALESFYINVAVMKRHPLTTVSLSTKNQKGLLTDSYKKRFHIDWGLHMPIAAFLEVIRPNLTVVEYHYPKRQGRQEEVNKPRLIVMGRDPIAVDCTCCRIMGVEPSTVEHLKIAWESGLGQRDAVILGESISSVRRDLPKVSRKRRSILPISLSKNPRACCLCRFAIHRSMGEAKKVKHLPKFTLKMASYALS